ncbi:hypothetical protein CMO92_02920 [Candidatus Woesearchaeota archaeon]|nr:hypothetical protein [Candidatus Woesearchaeota archaeon]
MAKKNSKNMKTLFDKPATNPIYKGLYLIAIILILFGVYLLSKTLLTPPVQTFPLPEGSDVSNYSVPFYIFTDCTENTIIACQQFAIFSIKGEAQSLPLGSYGGKIDQATTLYKQSAGKKLEKATALLQVESFPDPEDENNNILFSPSIYLVDLENNIVKLSESWNFVMRDPERSREICKTIYSGAECLEKTGFIYAAALKDKTICSQYSDNPLLYKDCLDNVAVALEYADLCSKESNCINKIAVKTQNRSVCNNKYTITGHIRCLQDVRFIESVQNSNTTGCLNMTGKKNCLTQIAIKEQDQTICEEAGTPEDKESCLLTFAIETENHELCSELTEEEPCLRQVAYAKKDPSLCPETDTTCSNKLAITLQDTTLCKDELCSKQVKTAQKLGLVCSPNDNICNAFIEQES